jgi:hypothetical protein
MTYQTTIISPLASPQINSYTTTVGGGGGGGPTVAFTGSVIGNNYYTSTNTMGKINAEDVIIEGISVKEAICSIKSIQDRLSILIPDPKKLEKYAALQECYKQYKLLEALIAEDNLPAVDNI